MRAFFASEFAPTIMPPAPMAVCFPTGLSL